MKRLIIPVLILIAMFWKTAVSAEDSKAEWRELNAGPIQTKFQDGELRYLYVGRQEVVRRIYFAVRDEKWNTVMPVFSRCDIQQKKDSFLIHLAAACSNEKTHYRWTAEITGTADGTIVFRVTGKPEKNFRANRIGLCILYGAESLTGQKFETLDTNGSVKTGEFPAPVTTDLVASGFQTLRYKTASAISFNAELSGGTVFMEDQRNFGDSSWKAYANILAGPEALAGEEKTQTLVISVKPGTRELPAGNKKIKTAVLPRLTVTDADAKICFYDLNRKRPAGMEVSWQFSPSVHLNDDDTLMENTSTVIDQATTVKSWAPDVRMTVNPISFNRSGSDKDPRHETDFEAAWTLAMVKALSVAGVAEAGFNVTGAGRSLLMALEPYAGKTLTDRPVDDLLSAKLTVLDTGPELWMGNKTSGYLPVSFDLLAGFKSQDIVLKPFEVRNLKKSPQEEK